MALFKSDEEIYKEAKNKIFIKKEFDGRLVKYIKVQVNLDYGESWIMEK